MLLLDVNIVLAAHRGDHPQHAEVRFWFDGLLAGDQQFTVPLLVWASFLRVATSRRIFEVQPLEMTHSRSSKPRAHSRNTSRPRQAPVTSSCCANSATRRTRPVTSFPMR